MCEPIPVESLTETLKDRGCDLFTRSSSGTNRSFHYLRTLSKITCYDPIDNYNLQLFFIGDFSHLKTAGKVGSFVTQEIYGTSFVCVTVTENNIELKCICN